jgi:hypothetical protein
MNSTDLELLNAQNFGLKIKFLLIFGDDSYSYSQNIGYELYSDLDVSVIDEMPVGRKPIITAHRREKDRAYVYNFCRRKFRKETGLFCLSFN